MNLLHLFVYFISLGPFFWVLFGRESFRNAFFVKYLPSNETPVLIMAAIVWFIVMLVIISVVTGALNDQARVRQANAGSPDQ